MHVPKKMALRRLWSNEMTLKQTTCSDEMTLKRTPHRRRWLSDIVCPRSHSTMVAAAAATARRVAAGARGARIAAGAWVIAKIARAAVLRAAASAAGGAGPTSTRPAGRSRVRVRTASGAGPTSAGIAGGRRALEIVARGRIDRTVQPRIPALSRKERGLVDARKV